MTEREMVLRILTAGLRADGMDAQTLATQLREWCGKGWSSGSGWLPHVPRDTEAFMDPATEYRSVRQEWMQSGHTYEYSCRVTGVYIGPSAHTRALGKRERPDLTWLEVARYALGQMQPQQLTLWKTAVAA